MSDKLLDLAIFIVAIIVGAWVLKWLGVFDSPPIIIHDARALVGK